MSFFIKFSAILLMTLSSGCDSAKTPAQETPDVKNAETMDDSKMLNDGFKVGTVIYQKDSKCAYIIVDDKTGAMMDPINFEDDKFKSFRAKDTKIYFKFRGLRMANRCTDIQPIELVEMQAGS